MRNFFKSLFSFAPPQLVIGRPEDLAVHDANDDGFAPFNLTINDAAVLAGLDPSQYDVAYFETFQAAKKNIYALEDAKEYYNIEPMIQEIFVRITSKDNPKNYAVASFILAANPAKVIDLATYKREKNNSSSSLEQASVNE